MRGKCVWDYQEEYGADYLLRRLGINGKLKL